MIAGTAALMSDLGLVGTGAHPYSLTINGDDVIAKVPLESISAIEAGAGGVSSMHFDIWDTDASMVIPDGAEFIFHDNTNSFRVFGGHLERWSSSPAFGGLGRILQISAFGYEAQLDLCIIAKLTIPFFGFGQTPAGNEFFLGDTEIVELVASYAPLRSFAEVGSNESNQDGPIGFSTYRLTSETPDVVLDGLTLRQAWEAWQDQAVPLADSNFKIPVQILTVDFYRGVRFFTGTVTHIPTDYDSITIGAGVYGTDLQYEEDHSPGAIVNAVYVKGAAAASTGWVVGDTTTGRREAYTTTIGTTTEAKIAAANTIFNRQGDIAGRGSIRLENFTPVNAHCGGLITITDANMNWTSRQFLISQIDRDFVNVSPGKHNWTVHFFDPGMAATAGPPSGSRLLRTLTRQTPH